MWGAGLELTAVWHVRWNLVGYVYTCAYTYIYIFIAILHLKRQFFVGPGEAGASKRHRRQPQSST